MNPGISCLLDREKIKQDRVSPMFMAYGLIERLISINKQIADEEWKKNLIDLPTGIDEKKKDALKHLFEKASDQISFVASLILFSINCYQFRYSN